MGNTTKLPPGFVLDGEGSKYNTIPSASNNVNAINAPQGFVLDKKVLSPSPENEVRQGPITKGLQSAINTLSITNLEKDPEARAMMQTFGYLGGLGATVGIHATPIGILAKALSGKKSGGSDGIEELKKSLKGQASPTPEQFQRYLGLSPLVADVAAIPYTTATDPLASAFSMQTSGRLRSAAENSAVKHLRPTPKVAYSLGPKKLKDIGREALDTDAIKFFSKAETTAANLADNQLTSGRLIDDYLNSSNAKIDPRSIAVKFDSDVIQPLRGIDEHKALVRQLERKRDSFLETYGASGSNMSEITPLQINKEKGAVQDSVNYQDSRQGANARNQSKMDWARVLRKEEEAAMNSPGFNSAKRSYGNSAAAESMADRTAALTNGGTGLTGNLADLGVNLEALKELSKGSAAGIPLAVARGLTKGRIASSTAVTMDALSKLAKRLNDKGISGTGTIRQSTINNYSPWLGLRNTNE